MIYATPATGFLGLLVLFVLILGGVRIGAASARVMPTTDPRCVSSSAARFCAPTNVGARSSRG